MTFLSRHPVRMILAVALIALLAGCVRVSTGSDPVDTQAPPQVTLPPRPTAPPVATPTPTVAPTPTPDDGAVEVDVALLDSLQIKPSKITVQAGKPIRFVITNEGRLEHDFFIGSDREQKQRESGQGEPGPDRYVAVPPGQTVTLLYVFPSPGKTIAGCVIPGHYTAGMKANITIE